MQVNAHVSIGSRVNDKGKRQVRFGKVHLTCRKVANEKREYLGTGKVR